jgi:hypothetical protein
MNHPEKGDSAMALVACRECGRQISTLAASCPGCGCPAAPAAPGQETQSAAGAAPKSEPAPVKPSEQLLAALKERGAEYDGHTLRIRDEAISILQDIARHLAEVVTRILVMDNGWQDRHIQQLVEQFPNLRELTIIGGKFLTDESLVHISSLQSLTKLDLESVGSIYAAGDTSYRSVEFTERGYKRLTRLGNLRFIKLPKREIQAPEARSKLIAMLEQALPEAFVQ